MAAGLAQKMLRGHAEVESAGIAPFGEGAADEVVRVMGQEGIDLSGHRPRNVTRLSLRDFDCIVAMDALVHRYLNERCRVPHIKLIPWDIHDPFGQDMDAYEEALQAIRAHVKDLVFQLGLGSGEDG